jgi:hypothetical protein
MKRVPLSQACNIFGLGIITETNECNEHAHRTMMSGNTNSEFQKRKLNPRLIPP